MRTAKLHGKVGFYFESGWVNKHREDEQVHRKSYNLVITYTGEPILVIHYELNKTFSIEMSEKEIDRVEDMMANAALKIIFGFGIIYIIKTSTEQGIGFSEYMLESNDKRFLSLN